MSGWASGTSFSLLYVWWRVYSLQNLQEMYPQTTRKRRGERKMSGWASGTLSYSYKDLGVSEWDWLLNVTCNDISVIYVTAHRCAGRLKKEFDLWSGSQSHRHFVGFFNVSRPSTNTGPPFLRLFWETSQIETHRLAEERGLLSLMLKPSDTMIWRTKIIWQSIRFSVFNYFLCPRIEWSGAYCFCPVCLSVCLSVCCQL